LSFSIFTSSPERKDMVRLVLAMIVLGLCVPGAGVATAAPVSSAAPFDAQGSLSEPVHCRRWLPHRHQGAKPHGLGFGCAGKARSTRTKRA
jgi:hypothetical protein